MFYMCIHPYTGHVSNQSLTNVYDYIQIYTDIYSRVTLGDYACPTGDQEVAGSTPSGSASFSRRDLILKYFLWSFSPFC